MRCWCDLRMMLQSYRLSDSVNLGFCLFTWLYGLVSPECRTCCARLAKHFSFKLPTVGDRVWPPVCMLHTHFAVMLTVCFA